MAINSVTLSLNGQTYAIPLDGTSGKYKKTITAPTKSSYSQENHKYPMQLKVIDTAENVTIIDSADETYGNAMMLRVKETVAPIISVSAPGEGAYLTNASVSFSIDITDEDSGVAIDTISAKVDGIELNLTKTEITEGYRCICTTVVADGKHNLVVNATDNDGNAATEKTVSFVVDTVSPTLNISAPADTLITNKQICTIQGTTNDVTSGIASVQIKLNNTDQGSVMVASDGTFSKSLTLSKGENIIVVTATDKAGKYSTVNRKVVYDPDAPVIMSIDVNPNPVEAGGDFTITVQATD